MYMIADLYDIDFHRQINKSGHKTTICSQTMMFDQIEHIHREWHENCFALHYEQ